MNFNTDPFIAAQKTNVEVFAGLSKKTFASFEKLVELNMAASKAVIGESISNLQALVAAKDPQALLALQSSLLQPLSEKSASYSRHLYEIASGTAAEFSKAFESTAEKSQKGMASFLENSLKNAPAGSEAAVSAFKTAISASNTALESAQKTAKQAVQLIESNIDAVSSVTPKAD
ncbi:MAG: Phasin (PHA-granule associated protein) [Burkholderiales bacterium RIFCSPHIGHO2_12_FULL_61_11]|nr:MAG: Phasin (PHA-granule associated protein) [Burkholderiales bacterium RIFCSPHIGHO2_12_FULL_61_11]